ncbi:MAG TPA: hypothetical protein VGC15_08165 [Acetobacteraceae bacterium]
MREPPDAQPGAPDAVEAALERLGKLTAAGASPDAVTQTVGEIVAGWAGEADMDAAAAQARIGQMWDSLTKDEADLEEAISDAGEGDGASLAMARRVRAALQAAIRALAVVAERFG